MLSGVDDATCSAAFAELGLGLSSSWIEYGDKFSSPSLLSEMALYFVALHVDLPFLAPRFSPCWNYGPLGLIRIVSVMVKNARMEHSNNNKNE